MRIYKFVRIYQVFTHHECTLSTICAIFLIARGLKNFPSNIHDGINTMCKHIFYIFCIYINYIYCQYYLSSVDTNTCISELAEFACLHIHKKNNLVMIMCLLVLFGSC